MPTPLATLETLLTPKTIWLAGTRGEALCLGLLYRALRRTGHNPGLWLSTEEQGMALAQALDHLAIIPHESAPQCHPAEEPAQRLSIMLARAESFARQRHARTVIAAGWGPTAVGMALFAHSRGGGGVWLRPPDPAGLTARLGWESGNERVIRACGAAVRVIELDAQPWRAMEASERGAEPDKAEVEAELRLQLPRLDLDAPRVLVAVLRREWGVFDDKFTRLARASARWAADHSGTHFVLLSHLNSRLERPFRSIESPPANLHLAPPLPLSVYTRLLDGASAVLTDSPHIAAEALERKVELLTLGEMAGKAGAGRSVSWDEIAAMTWDSFS